MGVFAAHPWLAVAVPAALAVVIAACGERAARATRWLGVAGPATALAVGASYLLSGGEGGAWAASFGWLHAGDVTVSLGYAVDGLTAIMLVVVGLVAAMVMVFSAGYMAEETGLARYHAVLSLFTASMAGLVLADGFGGLFVAWELVGACSYLLIGFWFQKPSASAAAMKAFLVTRVGDVGLLVAIAIVWSRVGDLSYAGVFGGAEKLAGMLGAVCVLLFVGAAGKSAQFPLHIWLPDAMEGPTPVSALIHAATMVAAGVFLVARCWPLFEESPAALSVVLWIGTLTAVGAACAALAQRDIKKVLAYSTISQLGFMFAALGAGAWVAAVFHLVTHAAFKALLFLGSGSVIHGTHTQDLHEMGGLRKSMPVTAATWLVGSAALAGVPGLAGFFSKDEILHGVLAAQPVAGMVLAATALVTAFYVTRATMLAFGGEYRGSGHPHESGWEMSVPLVVLAVPAAGAGYLAHWIARTLGEHPEPLDLTTASISAAIVVVGIVAGWLAYRGGVSGDEAMAARLGNLWTLLSRAWGFDDLVRERVTMPALRGCAKLYKRVDRKVVDRIVEGTATAAARAGRWMAGMQSGDVQGYAFLMGAGIVLLIAMAVGMGR